MIAVNGMSFYKIPFLLRFRFVGLGLAFIVYGWFADEGVVKFRPSASTDNDECKLWDYVSPPPQKKSRLKRPVRPTNPNSWRPLWDILTAFCTYYYTVNTVNCMSHTGQVKRIKLTTLTAGCDRVVWRRTSSLGGRPDSASASRRRTARPPQLQHVPASLAPTSPNRHIQ